MSKDIIHHIEDEYAWAYEDDSDEESISVYDAYKK